MYDLIKTVIESHTYKDSNALLYRIQRMYVEGELSENQYTELRAMLYSSQPVKAYNVEAEIDAIWVELHRIALIIDNIPAPEPPAPDIPVWVQPTGAHDAYQTGDKVHYPTISDPVYESLIDGNVWSPVAYPAGWRELLQE